MKENVWTLKVVFIGKSGVGKTAYLNKLLAREWSFEHIEHIPTRGVNIVQYEHTWHSTHSNQTPLILNVWDCADFEKLTSLGEDYSSYLSSYLLDSDAAFIFVDKDSTFYEVEYYKHVFSKMCPGKPYIVIGVFKDYLSIEEFKLRSLNNGRCIDCLINIRMNVGWGYPMVALQSQQLNQRF